MGTVGRQGQGGAEQGSGPSAPLGATPRSAKLSLGSGRVAAAARKEARPGRPPAVPSAASRARLQPDTWSPRRARPEGMRQPQGIPLPGSAARASVSGEWGAGRGDDSRSRGRTGRAWGGQSARASAGPSFSGLPDVGPGSQTHSKYLGQDSPGGVWHIFLFPTSFLGVKKCNGNVKVAMRPPQLWAGRLGTGRGERGEAPSPLLWRRCFFAKLDLTAVRREQRFSRGA